MPELTDTPPAADDRTPVREPLRTRISDAIGWGWALLVTTITNAPRTWREATPRERTQLVVSLCFVLAVIAVAGDLARWWLWLLLAALVINLIADIDHVAKVGAERRKAVRMLTATPTGAPRVAEIACSRGVTHRFLYGPLGWEEAGPARHQT